MIAFFCRTRIALVGQTFIQATHPMHLASSTFIECVKVFSVMFTIEQDSDFESRAFAYLRRDYEPVGILLHIG